MIALVALTESMVITKNPIDPATMKIVIMCSAPAKRWTCDFHELSIQSACTPYTKLYKWLKLKHNS